MTRAALCIATALGLMASGAQAGPVSVSEAFGNTIVSTYPDGRKAELWLQPGGTYAVEGRRGDMSSGHWTVRGAKLCLKQAKPFGVPFSFCTPIPTSGFGQSWSAKAFGGVPVTVRLVKGHHTG